LYKFNIVTQTWASPYDFVPGGPANAPQEPFIFAYGGFAVLVDEANPALMFFIDSNAAPNAAWASITIIPPTDSTFQGRIGQRFLVWGSSLYMFGGYTPAVSPSLPIQYNDMWVISLSQAILGKTPVTWTKVSPNGDPITGLVASYPPPRIGYTWTPYQIGAIMYGGLSTSKQGEDVFSCFRQITPNPDCFFHENIWAILPGYQTQGTSPVMPPAAWIRLGNTGVNGGATPRGRAFHSSGQMGNQLFVYGGFTSTGPSSELWAYDLMSQNWGLVTSSGPAPTGRGAAIVAGFHFFVYSQNFVPGSGVAPNSGQLYRWSPTLFAGGGNNNQGNSNNASLNAIATGHTVGIVFGLLLGLANLYVLFRLAQNARLSICDFGSANGKAYLPSFATTDMSAAYEAPSL